MNSTVLQRRRVERFAQLLDEASGARRHHAKATIDDETSSLVSISQALTAATPEVHIREEFRRDTRAFLMAAAERDGIGRTAVAQPAVGRAQVSADGTVPSGARSLLPKSLSPKRKASQGVTTGRGRARGAILVGLAVGTLALSGISAASGNAQPGDALYSIKLQEENAQLALAGSNVKKGQLYLGFAQTRMSEAQGVRSDTDLLTGVLDNMDSETAAGATLLFNDAVKHHNTNDLKSVNTFVTAQQTQLEQLKQGLPDGPARSRVLGSEKLLGRVSTRSDAIRDAFNCAATVTKPANDLGVELLCKESTTVTPNSAPTGKPTSKGTITKPDAHSSSSATTPASAPTPSSTPVAQSNNNAPVVAPSQSPTSDGGLLGDVAKLLGGL